MNYIIIDLEWNQARSGRDIVADRDGNKLYGEVIQVGAIKLSEKLKITDELKINVRPKYYKVIHRKVRQITGISQEDLMRGEEFCTAMEKLRSWCGEDFAFLTWGPDDIRVLRRNIEMYGEDSSWIDTWFNLQTMYNMQTDSGDNQKSLATAMEHFGITPSEPFHDALNDAYYTALVAGKLDIPRGIAELISAERLRTILDESRPLICEVYSGFKARRDVLRDKEVSAVKCPDCGLFCDNVRKWVAERNDRFITLATCPEHGDYVIRLTLSKTNDIYNATKVIYEAGGGAEIYYEKRAKKEAANKKSRRRRRTAAVAPRKKMSEKVEKQTEK
ncbi:MAG: exonuclease domain-containing protein [Oscillospiraceae bacterium]|nr:exonuclease domain-containing protein [Oscillospiraceae bacterium]